MVPNNEGAAIQGVTPPSGRLARRRSAPLPDRANVECWMLSVECSGLGLGSFHSTFNIPRPRSLAARSWRPEAVDLAGRRSALQKLVRHFLFFALDDQNVELCHSLERLNHDA